ncbi:MAG: hypothetical protein ACO34C_05815, partial [Candidatus Kapaibacteriota bacterium]
ITASQTVTAGTGLVATTGGVSFTGQLKSNVVQAANNSAINPANGSVFQYNEGPNLLNSGTFGAGSDGQIIYVYSPDAQANYDGTNSLAPDNVVCFVYVNGAWRTVDND